ncbi:hypothetical protein H4R18_000814 [Coemansia javaensis]|uniref:Uncharacterized protein n=1 Tax=Coemansia javaensis TaxID=2761396 RepID=A0A9W8LMF3_9FUNG|nr:hypothetical protein H4R18_000814 [Coemansia javaensis]
MLGLIRMLPNLTSLRIWNLTVKDISVPEPDEDCLVEPFSTKIKEMKISVSPDESEPEMLVVVAKYLLLRIPTLFVRAYSKHNDD